MPVESEYAGAPPCGSCGTVNKPAARFCRKCGASLQIAPAAAPGSDPPVLPGPPTAPTADQVPADQPNTSAGRLDPRIALSAVGACVLIALVWYAIGSHKQTPAYQAPPVPAAPTATSVGAPAAQSAPAPTDQMAGIVRLTTDPSRDIAPAWTSNGNILFQSNRNSNRSNGNDIWEMRPDGTGQREIVHVNVSTPPEWGDSGLGGGVEVLGATGDLAVYEAQHFHEIMRVATSRAAAFPIVRTAQDGDDAYFTQLLQIPGGQSASNIVYCEATGMVAWVANISGQAIQIRTASLASITGQSSDTYGVQLASLAPGGNVQGMSYSPDGARLVAAMCSQDCGNGRGPDLYILDSRSGQTLQQLTSTGANGSSNSSPKWSPSGAWIAFGLTNAGQQSLWLISTEGGPTLRRIDTGEMPSYGPSWSRDGSAIAFVGVTGGNHDIWLARNVAPLMGQAAEAAEPTFQAEASGSGANPSFNCASAKTPTEKLICRDTSLASMERTMVTAYNQALRQLPPDQGAAFRLQHLEWFKTYSRTCNTATDDEQRKACIAGYLSSHTRQVEAKVQR
jgi:uncharacterized protein YecT (DUF1311 family)